MNPKAFILIVVVVFLCSVLINAQTINQTYRLQVLQAVKALPRTPAYIKALQFTDLSRMEFAVILGRLLEEYPNLKIGLREVTNYVSWELSKLGYQV
ncbi:MAG TPA: hypothetical protein GX522_06735 [Firmicutes bacterium]|jgi:hypothetical protein|nr:hypothetical protein [Bacillota bacterium]